MKKKLFCYGSIYVLYTDMLEKAE